ncbi:MAG: hypothetical protein IJD70_00710 [Clostridia bacterium]|nr:hypothetical protein [Clostridia bacterium]
MKPKIAAVAALILLLCVFLSSCVGIGDGALFDNIQSSGEKNTEKLPENIKTNEMYFAEVGQYVETSMEAVFKKYSPSGDLQADLSFGYTVAKEFYDIIFSGEREERDCDRNQTYVDLKLYLASGDEPALWGGFRIYADDYVEITEDGVATLAWSGKLEGYSQGIFMRLLNCASYAIKPEYAKLTKVSFLSSRIPKSAELGADDAAELYKLLTTASVLTTNNDLVAVPSSFAVMITFRYGSFEAHFIVDQNDTIKQSYGFLEGNASFDTRYSEGIFQKLMDYLE